MAEYRTQDGDVLDAICARHYGTEHGTTELVLQTNPGLADQPVALPSGLLITLPDLAKPGTTAQTVNLWD